MATGNYLNEKDSLQDMLNLEKSMMKVYATAWTEGASKSFRSLLKTHITETATDQMQVFSEMKELGYYKTENAPQTTISEQKNKFSKIKAELN